MLKYATRIIYSKTARYLVDRVHGEKYGRYIYTDPKNIYVRHGSKDAVPLVHIEISNK